MGGRLSWFNDLTNPLKGKQHLMRTIRSVLSAAALLAAGAVFAAPASAEQEEVTVTSCDDPQTDCFGPPDIGGPCSYEGRPGTVNEDGLCICVVPDDEDEEEPEPPEPECEECEQEADAPEPAPEDDQPEPQPEPQSQPADPVADAPASSTSPAPSAAPVAGQPTMTG